MTVIEELIEALGTDCVLTGEAIGERYRSDASATGRSLPLAVLRPSTTEQVSVALAICDRHRQPVVPQGGLTGLAGGANARTGDIAISLERMSGVEDLDPAAGTMTVLAGTPLEVGQLVAEAAGFLLPIDLGARGSCQIGGNISTNAGGIRVIRHGVTRDNVLGLEAVLADGTVLSSLNGMTKNNTGYDLRQLFIGSEGTLGIITQLNLKLYGIPDTILSGVCPFPSVRQACDAVIQTIQAGIPVARIELLDAPAVQASINYSKIDLPPSPCLFVELHGSAASVAEQAEFFAAITEENGGGPFAGSTRTEERAKLWKARHDFYWAGMTLRPGAASIATDVCVPVSALSDCIGETQDDIAALGLIAPIVGHVGDGNFHVTLLLDQDSPAEIDQAEAFIARLSQRALKFDGTCTGEHGVGQGKRGYLEDELGAALGVMRQIKEALDPRNILNPGKIFMAG